MKSRKIITSSIIALTLLGSSAPLFAGASTVNSNSTLGQMQNENDAQISQEFINKFDGYISFTNNKFVLNEELLPKTTTKADKEKLEFFISKSNEGITDFYRDASDATVKKTGNSVVAVYDDEGDTSDKPTSRGFKEGSNYVHKYWWGYRAGISRTKIRRVGAVVQDAGVVAGGYALIAAVPGVGLPAGAAVGAVAGGLGIGGTALKYCPGGIVFNWTSAYPLTLWGVGFQ